MFARHHTPIYMQVTEFIIERPMIAFSLGVFQLITAFEPVTMQMLQIVTWCITSLVGVITIIGNYEKYKKKVLTWKNKRKKPFK